MIGSRVIRDTSQEIIKKFSHFTVYFFPIYNVRSWCSVPRGHGAKFFSLLIGVR